MDKDIPVIFYINDWPSFSPRKRISHNSYVVVFLRYGRLTDVYLICIYFSARKQHKNDSAGRIQMFKSFLVVVFASWGENVPVVTQDDLS